MNDSLGFAKTTHDSCGDDRASPGACEEGGVVVCSDPVMAARCVRIEMRLSRTKTTKS